MLLKRDEILTILGLLLSLPSFFLVFVSGNIAAGLLTLLLAVGVFVVRWLINLPEFTLLEVEKTLTIHDKEGHRATYTRRQRGRANHKGITEVWFKGMTHDGRVENVFIDGRPPDLQNPQYGTLQFGKRFPRALPRGKEFETVFSCDYVDTFTASTEVFGHIVSYKTRKLRIVIIAPHDRPFRSVRMSLKYSGEIHQSLPEPKVSADRCRAEYEHLRPRMGGEFHFEWDW